MKDEHDKRTIDLLNEQSRKARPFNPFRAVTDMESLGQPRPKEATSRALGGSYVPVSFVAKDWKVTPRRIRALLLGGRLEGRQQANGYWEVCYPYQFIFGTRGPSLKRAQRPSKGPRLVVDNTEPIRE